jgi:hypothetical protein
MVSRGRKELGCRDFYRLNIPAATVFFQGNNAQDMADKGVLVNEEPICSIDF